MRMINANMVELGIAMKHLNAMFKEVDAYRESELKQWSWGDGFFLDFSDIEVQTDAKEPIGKLTMTEFGWDFEPHVD